MLALAETYSFGVSAVFSCRYSLSQSALFSSNASGMPPHPTYRDKVCCSSGVAVRFSASICFNAAIAAMFMANLAFGPPVPSWSSVITKFSAAGSSLTSDGSSTISCFLILSDAGSATVISSGLALSSGHGSSTAGCCASAKASLPFCPASETGGSCVSASTGYVSANISCKI